MEDVLRGKCTNVTNGQIMSTDCGQMRFATWKFFRCFWLGGGGAGGRIGCSREGLDKVTINHKQLTINHLPLTINYKLSTINQGLWKRSSTFGWTIPILMDLCCFQGEGSRYDQKKTSTSLHQGLTLHHSPHLTSPPRPHWGKEMPKNAGDRPMVGYLQQAFVKDLEMVRTSSHFWSWNPFGWFEITIIRSSCFR